MEELVECIVKRRLTMKAYFGRCLSVALGILMVIITYVAALKVPYGIPVVLLFDLAAGFIIYFVFRNTSVEFEYDYFGGELTVDKILNRAKRKRLRIFDFAKLDYIAKYGSERMTRLEEHGNSVYYNYSAHDIREDSYVAVFHNDEKATVFLEFSPSEELLAVLKKYYPRKVYED